jgi:cell division septum initiation protein DivIVA|tara:strand:+ start:635 stop:877 length:243 start_codon:yes stop_codon:yes gene_type:complete
MTIISENKELKERIKDLEKEIINLKDKKEKKPKKKREPSGYQKFVKSKFAYFKEQNPGKTAPEIIKLIAQEWKKTKSDDS